MPVVNESQLHVWQLGVTGRAGNMTKALKRYPSASSEVSASETVTVAEIGSTGSYAVTYTPTLGQLYVGLITETLLGATYSFTDEVLTGPESVTVDDAYCSMADVIAFAQAGTYSSSTVPTESEVLGFMAKRASRVYSALAKVMGASAPGPANYATTIDTTTDKGKALSQACRFANAVGAAMDALEAAGANQAPAKSERVAELGVLWMGCIADLEYAAQAYQGTAGGLARTHVSTGEITQPSVTAREQQGLLFNHLTRF